MKCHLIQNGSDGFGHQLYGLFSTMILHNIRNYFFDGQMYCRKKFCITNRVNKTEKVKQYLIEAVKNFCYDHQQFSPIQYKNIIHSHEIYKVPSDYKEDCLYSIDNAYYFDRIGLNDEERKCHTKNIEQYSKYFVENNYLPKNRLKENNIVIHIRQGDALLYPQWAEKIKLHKENIKILIKKLEVKYPDYQIYIHSNGNVDFLKNYNFIFYGKEIPLLQMLSDFIHAKIFVCGNSAFSKVCTFLGDRDLIIVPNTSSPEFDCSVSNKSISITDYITNN